jgi:hypothetical protein
MTIIYTITECKRERAIALNREIICQWEPSQLMDVLQENHNHYMAMAALQLLVEDLSFIRRVDMDMLILFAEPLRKHFDIWHEINELEGEKDARWERDHCPSCELLNDDCYCDNEGWDRGVCQSMFI